LNYYFFFDTGDINTDDRLLRRTIVRPVSMASLTLPQNFLILKTIIMRKIILLFVLITIAAAVKAQNDYRVVFDMTSRDSINQQSVIRQVTGISKSNADAKLEVVIYSQGLDMVVKGKSLQEPAVSQLLANNKNISFKVCEITMKRYNVDKSQLVAGVEVVPDGIYEIITKQREGWGYIKVAH